MQRKFRGSHHRAAAYYALLTDTSVMFAAAEFLAERGDERHSFVGQVDRQSR
jgi:hypothetical protein